MGGRKRGSGADISLPATPTLSSPPTHKLSHRPSRGEKAVTAGEREGEAGINGNLCVGQQQDGWFHPPPLRFPRALCEKAELVPRLSQCPTAFSLSPSLPPQQAAAAAAAAKGSRRGETTLSSSSSPSLGEDEKRGGLACQPQIFVALSFLCSLYTSQYTNKGWKNSFSPAFYIILRLIKHVSVL
jgi:hypothetical protein